MKSLLFSLALPLFAASASIAADGVPPPIIAPLFAKDQGDTRAVLLIKDGRLIAKHYSAGYSDANRFISWSMAKSVTAVLIGELVADGKLSLDAPVPIAEWQAAGDPRGAITLRAMLHMSSGISHVEVGDPVYASDTNQILFVGGTNDMATRAIAKSLESTPGTVYEYSSMTSLILAELITRTLTPSRNPKTRARAYQAFAQARLFDPAGITSAVFDFDGAGTQIGGSIIYMSLDDWGRFGNILLSGKGVRGDRIVDAHWLGFMRTPAPTNGAYGGHVWLNRKGPPGADEALFAGTGPDTLFSCVGHLGQYVIASPDQAIVLVRLGKTNDPDLAPVRAALGQIISQFPTNAKAHKPDV